MQKPEIKLIVGLGNPGDAYEHTRHNIGADFVKLFADQSGTGFKRESKFKGFYGQIKTPEALCHLLLPTTYMNNSGEAVQAITQFYKIPVESILVVHDELDLPIGTLRLKQQGGHGGHNGVRDIIEKLKDKNFLRLRIGIGRPEHSGEVMNYVLKRPPQQDYKMSLNAMEDAMRIMPDLMDGEVTRAIQDLHTK